MVVVEFSSNTMSVRTYLNHVCGTLFHIRHTVAHVAQYSTILLNIAQYAKYVWHNVTCCAKVWHVMQFCGIVCPRVPQKFTREINTKEECNEQEKIPAQTSWLFAPYLR